MARKGYATVKIPIELAASLDELAESLGYRSRAEMVNDAIRRFIETRKSPFIKNSGFEGHKQRELPVTA